MDVSPPLETPVVLIIFNRPETTRLVLAKIAAMRPRRLFVIADAPRPDHPEDVERCAQARALLGSVDWPCEVIADYSSDHQGLRRRISSGLDGVFAQVEEAIILEDDCLPEATFFPFCQQLLDCYRDEQRVMMIGGTNYQFGRHSLPASYYFSIFPHIWGWATWRRAWQAYDVEMRRWPEARRSGLVERLFPVRREQRYWQRRFDRTYSGQIDTWDYQWTLACWMNEGLSIVPAVNLVSNLGFGVRAHHTLGRRSPYSRMATGAMPFPLIHPVELTPFVAADRYTQRTVFREHPLAPLKKRLKEILAAFRVRT